MSNLPATTDNSHEAQALRQAAVDACDCPKCGALKGHACATTNGGYYNPRFNVHRQRLIRAQEKR